MGIHGMMGGVYMKFRTNLKAENLFRWVAIVSLLPTVAFGVVYFITNDTDFLRLFLPCMLIAPCYFAVAYFCGTNYVEFQKDKIVFTKKPSLDF